MTRLVCDRPTLVNTIELLQAAGRRSEERVVLWLAEVSSQEPFSITEVYEPEQVTDIDYFRLPPRSLRALASHLRARRLKVVAQVHSHPKEAFHSEVDDEWAIIRQVGALSLVLPDFARETTPETFLGLVAIYELSRRNAWIRVPAAGPEGRIGVVP